MGDNEGEEVEELPPPEPLEASTFGGTYSTATLRPGQSGNGFTLELNPEDQSFTMFHRACFLAVGTDSYADTWQTRDRVFKGSWAQEPKLGGDDGKMVEQELTLTSAEEVVTVATDFPDSPEEELQKTNPQAALSWTLNIHLEAQDKLQEVFQAMDADGSGKLSKIEVLRAVRDHETVVQMLQASPKLAGLMRPQSWQDAFRSFDTDNDDTITAEELRRFCLENVPDYATSLQLKASTYPVAMSDEGFSAGKTHSMSFLQLSFVKTADYVPPAE